MVSELFLSQRQRALLREKGLPVERLEVRTVGGTGLVRLWVQGRLSAVSSLNALIGALRYKNNMQK